VQLSEYHRLHEELDRLATKHAWTGVERTWQALVATGVEPTDDDRIVAAHAALERGDLMLARERLLVVAARSENRAVIETLYRIDHDYGRVTLSGHTELVQETKPFLPEAEAAAALAAETLATTGSFDGFLPPGRYRFGMDIIEVEAGATQTVEQDAGADGRRRRRPGTW
jgi:hypothetical protein